MAIERKIDVDTVRIEIIPDQGWVPKITELQKLGSARRTLVEILSTRDNAQLFEKDIQRLLHDHNIDEDFDFGGAFDLDLDGGDIVYEHVYEVNGTNYESLIEALEAEMDLEIPGSKFYTYRFQRHNDDIMTSGSTHSFEELVEQAYYYPNQFSCTGTNDEEYEFIKSILAYKIEEKLKS